MPQLTVGEVRAHLAQCRESASALRTKVRGLPLGLGTNGIVVQPVPLPMSQCRVVTAERLLAGDYAEGLDGIIQWIDDVTATLRAPDDQPFALEELK
jgi:hypothetical protein